jgi:hypothetical protein
MRKSVPHSRTSSEIIGRKLRDDGNILLFPPTEVVSVVEARPNVIEYNAEPSARSKNETITAIYLESDVSGTISLHQNADLSSLSKLSSKDSSATYFDESRIIIDRKVPMKQFNIEQTSNMKRNHSEILALSQPDDRYGAACFQHIVYRFFITLSQTL